MRLRSSTRVRTDQALPDEIIQKCCGYGFTDKYAFRVKAVACAEGEFSILLDLKMLDSGLEAKPAYFAMDYQEGILA